MDCTTNFVLISILENEYKLFDTATELNYTEPQIRTFSQLVERHHPFLL